MKEWKNFCKVSMALNFIAWIGCGFCAGINLVQAHPIAAIGYILMSLTNGIIFINRNRIYKY